MFEKNVTLFCLLASRILVCKCLRKPWKNHFFFLEKPHMPVICQCQLTTLAPSQPGCGFLAV